jgi:hypothetical protein
MMLMAALVVVFCWMGLSAREFDRGTRQRLLACIAVLVIADLFRGVL